MLLYPSSPVALRPEIAAHRCARCLLGPDPDRRDCALRHLRDDGLDPGPLPPASAAPDPSQA